MSWFLAKIVYRIICGDGSHTAQFDEQLRLINAIDEASAFEKARQIGKQEQEVFPNSHQQLVHWQFVNVSELYKISELIDGAELYSRVEETESADVYIENVHKKAAYLHTSIVQKFLPLF